MAREKIGTVKDYNEESSGEEVIGEVTLELTGKLEKKDKIALLGPVAYKPVEIKSIEKEGEKINEAEEGEIKIIVKSEEEINARENTTVYKIN